MAGDQSSNARPNVLIIVADDMGFSDAGCYGGEIQTPNLDSLAKGGLRFSQFYNTARCWPSRAALLTGYYAQQVGRDLVPGKGGGAGGQRPAWAGLLPAMLKPLGYRSYHAGKWHVDGPVLAGGFDHSYSLDDHDRYFNPRNHSTDDTRLSAVGTNAGYYSTTAIASRAVAMLAEHQSGHASAPFFLYLAFTAPHFPLQALAEDYAVYQARYLQGWDTLRKERFENLRKLGFPAAGFNPIRTESLPGWNLPADQLSAQIGPGEAGLALPWASLSKEQQVFQPVKMALHAAMVHRMDIEIGRVLDQVRKMKAWDNTLILFVSDNGASAEQIIRGDRHDQTARPGSAGTFLCLGPGWASAANTPFRLYKCWVHEGGISTPLIVHWPARIQSAGQWRHAPGHLIDLVPTVLEVTGGKAAGGPRPPMPGKSLVPAFGSDVPVSREDLWWFHEGNRAIRVGDWKLVAEKDKDWELYDLKNDRSETLNQAQTHPDKVKDLVKKWEKRMEEFKAAAPAQSPPAKGKKGKRT